MAERIDVPEPASAILRRLHEEATRDCRGTDELIAKQRARRAARNALPALADLVAAIENMEKFCDCSFGGCDWTDAVHAATAALREQLEVSRG